MVEIRNIVFDLGGVLVNEGEDNVSLDVARSLNIQLKHLKNFQGKFYGEVRKGKMSLEEFYRNFLEDNKKTGISPQDVLFTHLDSYIHHTQKVDDEILSSVRSLRAKGYILSCITNTEPEIEKISRERLLFEQFDKSFISTRMGLVFPEREAYNFVLDDLNVKPQEALFIDDNEYYVGVSRELGIPTIHYIAPAQLKEELKGLDIKL